MNKISYIVLIVLCMALYGCNNGCIRVGGEYAGATGEVEYCFDSKQASEAGVPVFTDDSGESFFGFDGETVNKLIDKLKDKFGFSVSSGSDERHPVQQLLDMLEEEEGCHEVEE